MASLKRVTLKNGRIVYRIAISLGSDSQGHKMAKNVTYSVNQSASFRQQEKEALKYALELEDRIKYGHNADNRKMLFDEFARKWLETAKETLASGTYVGYEQLLRCRILPYFRTYRLTSIRTADIEAFYKTLSGEYAPGTVRRYANVLNGIFGTAKRWNLITENPCQGAKKPKKAQEQPKLRYFTPQQSLIFLKSLNLSYEVLYKKHLRNGPDGQSCRIEDYRKLYRVPIQYRLFYTLSLFCGFRKGETLALQWEDIDFEKKEISISKAIGRTEAGFGCKEPKNAMSVRKVPFPECILPLLQEYGKYYGQLRDCQGNLFLRPDGKLMGQTTAYQYFVKHLKRYNQWVRDNPEKAAEEGLEALPPIPLHGLRHSCATLLNYLDVNIIDISRYLGHASCSTTMNIYAHSFEEQKRVACNRLNEFVGGKI